jgi:hypothetical protein
MHATYTSKIATRLARLIGTLVFAGVMLLPGCRTVREFASLRNVNFDLDRVSDVRLAGIDVARIRSYEDLGMMDVARLTAAVARKELPLDLVVHVRAENPPENRVQARLVRLDWTLFLDDHETVSGAFDDTVLLPPGEAKDLPFTVRLDLVRFFDKNARDLVELALALSGQGGAPKRISLKATPTIDTVLGPIRYPNPITIVSGEAGS